MGLLLNTRVIVIALALGALPALAAGPAKKRAPAPCDTDFELKVTVQPVDGDAADQPDSSMGFKLDYKAGAKRGIASRLHTGQSTPFDQKACLAWRQQQFDRIDRIAFDNGNPRRRSVQCRNIASIRYKSAAQQKKVNVCLAGAQKDYVTYAFQLFYNGGDLLIAK